MCRESEEIKRCIQRVKKVRNVYTEELAILCANFIISKSAFGSPA